MVRGVEVVRGDIPWSVISSGRVLATYVIGSTKTSLIPNISIAGSIPIATLFTPALDVEYLKLGRPTTLDIIPATPNGIPTPALITRSALITSKIPYLVVDSGSYVEPKIPRIVLPSRCVGGRIDLEQALPPGTSEKLFNEALSLGLTLGSIADVVLIGESIPGGTTTAMAILYALGFKHLKLISSSMRDNPIEIKKAVVERAVKRLNNSLNVFEVNDYVGDPVHISVAGIALGVLQSNSYVVLAGGTQMLSVLAIMGAVMSSFNQEKVIHATTKWVIRDRGRELSEFLSTYYPRVTLVYSDLDFTNAPFEGLRLYEEGYVKEGVGAGGTAFLALTRGVGYDDLINTIYDEYSRLVGVRSA